MAYRKDRRIDPERSYEELLSGLTLAELQYIRNRWDFKGISHLKKDKLVKELASRIPQALNDWLCLITLELKELLTTLIKQDGCILLDYEEEEELEVYHYLQNRGIAFYGDYQNKLILVIPTEILQLLKTSINNDSELLDKIEKNTELVLLTIGILVYYGVYRTIKLPELVSRYLDYRLDILDYFHIIHEFMERSHLIYPTRHLMLAIDYLEEPEWVLDEQAMRSNIPYYDMSKSELLYSGTNMVPPLHKYYKKLITFLERYNLNNEKIEMLTNSIYIAINNDYSILDAASLVMEVAGLRTEKQLKELGEHLLEAYNNSPQWILKGNTPNMVTEISSRQIAEEKVVSLVDYKKYKKDCQSN